MAIAACTRARSNRRGWIIARLRCHGLSRFQQGSVVISPNVTDLRDDVSMRETHDGQGERRQICGPMQIGCTMSQRARSGLFRRAAFGLVGVGIAALGVAGCGTDAGGKDKAILNRFEAISCAKQIVVGRADRVEDGQKKDTVTVTVDVEEWIKPADGPTVLVLKDIVDPDNFGGEPWKIGGRRLLYVPEPGDLRFTPAEVGQTGLGLDGGKSLDDSIQGTKTELAQGLRTTCPSK